MLQRLLNFLISLDQFILSVITLGGAMPDETMSSAAYRSELLGKPTKFFRPMIDKILWFDKDHCRKAYESEKLRLQLPKDM